ncbi:hypothetical protein ACFQH6_02525 [Halobacteriaceae archaeon GCM10025711]
MSSLSSTNVAGVGLGGLLVIAGIVLFVIPEPVTSGLGVLLVLAGVLAWLLG